MYDADLRVGEVEFGFLEGTGKGAVFEFKHFEGFEGGEEREERGVILEVFQREGHLSF